MKSNENEAHSLVHLSFSHSSSFPHFLLSLFFFLHFLPSSCIGGNREAKSRSEIECSCLPTMKKKGGGIAFSRLPSILTVVGHHVRRRARNIKYDHTTCQYGLRHSQQQQECVTRRCRLSTCTASPLPTSCGVLPPCPGGLPGHGPIPVDSNHIYSLH